MTQPERREREVTALRERLVACHKQVCTADNCVLDGGPEHEEAFPDALDSSEGGLGEAAARGEFDA